MKPISVSTLAFYFLTLIILPSRNDPDWRKLVPLESTRADVERLLGPSKEVYFADYNLEEGYLTVIYSSGPCTADRSGGWNVARDVVISLSFSPKRKKSITEFKLESKEFRKVTNEHVSGVVYYINDEAGITYAVQRGRVDAMYYQPSSRYKHLDCRDPKNKPHRHG